MIEKELQEKNYVTINKENIALFREFHDQLTPNRKSGAEVEKYLVSHWHGQPSEDPELVSKLTDTLTKEDEFSKMPTDPGALSIRVYQVGHVKVALEETTGAFLVSGDEIDEKAKIWDDLFLYRGLNEEDLSNPFLVGTYVKIKGIEVKD
jgi:hypothetical protein